jgi:putative intracellular protease/amidase
MTEHDYLPGRIVGHEPGAFYNRLAKTLGGYVHEVLAELARQGIVQADAEGQPVVRVCEASAILGAAQIAVEADMRPIGLAEATPLRATWVPGQEQITWRLHSSPLAATPCEWNPENAASSLTSERLQAAYRRYLGREPPSRGR